MRNVQIIVHQGQLAAAVVAGQAIIEDTLPDPDFRHVQTMCLYAMEIADGERLGPYTDEGADAFARAALEATSSSVV